MADNVILDPGTGGATVATDDVGGTHYQRVKLTDGTADSSTAIAAGGGVEAGALRVTIANDSTGVVSIDDNGGNLSIDDGGNSITVDNAGTFAVQIAANSSINNAQVSGTAVSVNSGTKDAGTQRVILASDQTVVPISDNSGSLTVDNGGTFVVQENGAALTALQVIDNPVVVDDAAFTVATTSVNMAGFLADQASTDSVNEGDAGAARMTLDRKQIVTVAPSADTEGLSIFRTLDADETEEDVKTSAGKLYGWYLYNDGAAEVYVKFYNATAASTTVGSTTPILTIPVPAGAAANVEFANGITFSTALCIAATTAVGDADTTAPAANQVIANVFYQ